MKTPTRRSLVFLLGAFVFLLSGTMTLDSRLLGAVDCVGKPYGFPGCPTRSTSSLASSSGGVNTCGNAIVEDAEQCDKGRFNGKTDCSTDCKNLYCGDGVLSKDLGEECEPETQEFYVEDKNGNLTTEIRFVGATQCGWYCQPPQCNDAGTCTGGCKQQYVDQCTETGSTISAPASSAEQSSAATSQASTSAGTTLAVCGNSLVEGEEQCDDGNRNPVDECTNDCKKPLCGDGIIQKAEECDDGNTVNTDACSNSCKLPRCGDAIIQGKEECDDAARNSDALPNACRTNCLHSFCGDGVIDTGEQCDSALQNSDTVPNSCRTACRLPGCGDGVVDANEDCDDGNRSDNDSCTNLCKKSVCGDGVVQVPEECDWGARNSETEANSCRKTCRLPRCGDHIVDTGEECDGGDECSSTCTNKSATGGSSTSHRAAPTIITTGEGGGLNISLGALPIALATFGTLVVASALLFRRSIVRLFSKAGAKSIDDIPLDQLEMPWHKW